MPAEYPTRVELYPWSDWEVGTSLGTIARRANLAQLDVGDLYCQSAQNGEIGWKVALKAGTWQATVIHHRFSAFGIATLRLSGTTLGTIDFFGGGSNGNIATASGWTVPSGGVYTFSLLMATKNASASDYHFAIQHITLIRTGP